MKPGTRVAWVLEPGEADDGMRGTVREPTAEELAYVATWATTARMAVQGHVIVVWDSDEPWNCGWTDPDELREVTE